jgi:PAS domain S-box-containing protein
VAVASVALAVIATLPWASTLVSPLFFLAVILSAWFGGAGPGLLTAVLATLAIDYFFLLPKYTLNADPANVAQLFVFLLSAAVVSGMSAVRKRTFVLLQRARDELEARVQERTADLAAANERLRAEIAERARQAALLDLTHDTVFVRDMNDVITYWNRGAKELYGWDKNEIVGKTSHEVNKTVFPTPLPDITRTLFATGRWEGQLIHTKRDGTEVVVASRWALQRDEHGNAMAILETNNDITEQRHAEEGLRESEAQWRAVFENNPTMYFMVDAAGTILSVNPFGAEQLGYAVTELIGRPVLDVFHADDRNGVERNVAACLEQPGRAVSWEFRKVRKNSTVLWVRETARAMLLKGRAVVLVVCEDITERKRAEEQVRSTEQRYRNIFEAVGVSIWEEDFSEVQAAIDDLKAAGVRDFRDYTATHPEFVRRAISMVRVSDVNDATVKLFGAKSKDELLTSLDRVFVPETEEVFRGELIAIAEGRTHFESETILQTLTGRRLTVLFTITLPPPPARLDRVLVTVTDISERRRAAEALQKAEAELAHVTRVTTMGELASSIAHEVNQPLAAVTTNGNAALRWLGAEPPNLAEARACLTRIIRDGVRASEVVARIRALVKKSSPAREPVDVPELIREVLAMATTEARRHRVAVRTQCSIHVPGAWGDRIQLQQVMLNLVMNGIEAMKPVSDRPRELMIRCEPHQAGTILVAVRDSGIGLDPKNADRIFDAFYTTKVEGLGMGLSISRSIIEAHGGRLSATPNEDHGVTFQFTLPTNGGDHHD